MKKILLFIPLIIILVFLSNRELTFEDGIPDKDESKLWIKWYSNILVPDYEDFRAHWKNEDIAAYIFSYKIPSKLVNDGIESKFIIPKDGYSLYIKETDLIVFRKKVYYAGQNGFDEYRFEYNSANKRMYVLFANLDTETEYYDNILKIFNHVKTINI